MLHFLKTFLVMSKTKWLTRLLVPFQDLHHHEVYRMFYEGSGGTHQNHSHLVDISQLVHSYLLHQDIPENRVIESKIKNTIIWIPYCDCLNELVLLCFISDNEEWFTNLTNLSNAHRSFYLSFQPEKRFRHFRWNTTTLSQNFS